MRIIDEYLYFGKFKSELTAEEEKIIMDVEQKNISNFIVNTINTIEEKWRNLK